MAETPDELRAIIAALRARLAAAEAELHNKTLAYDVTLLRAHAAEAALSEARTALTTIEDITAGTGESGIWTLIVAPVHGVATQALAALSAAVPE